MEKHLVKLLLAEYKQDCLINLLSKYRIDVSVLGYQNLDIVADIIGIPADNSLEYRKKPHDEHFRCRDWIFDKWIEVCQEISLKQSNSSNDEFANEKISEYVNWLYSLPK